MLNRVVTILFFCSALIASENCFAQKNSGSGGEVSKHPVDLRRSVSSFNCGKIESLDSAVVEQYLLTNLKNIERPKHSLELIKFKRSKTGWHYHYQQNYLGKKVYRGTVKINLDNKGNVLSIFDNTYPIAADPRGNFPETEDTHKIVQALYHSENLLNRILSEKVYFYTGREIIPALRIEFWDVNGSFFEVIIDEEAKVIYERDMNMYFSKKKTNSVDTPAVARIFNPDPLTTAGVEYGAPYEDAADTDITQLNMQRQQVIIDVAFIDDTFRLESNYCKINEHSIPIVNPVTSLTPDFEFTRSQDGFEDVNAFYHINVYHDYIKDQLGFDNIVDYQIWVDTHGMGGADNSNFSHAGNPPRLSFGEGGVDDAEDGDVIIHEYGHAISHSAAPGTNNGADRPSLDEGIGDYFAASYSKSINQYNWEKIFSWDGHNEFWNGRVVNSTKHYPEDLGTNIYKNAEIWSSVMMQINGDIGREVTDEVLIESLFSYESNITMNDAACLLLQASQTLYTGQYSFAVSSWLEQRGFSGCGIGINERNSTQALLFNTIAFAKGDGDASVRFDQPQTGEILIIDAAGRIVHSEAFFNISELKMSSETLESGIYLMKVTSQNVSGCYKLMKW